MPLPPPHRAAAFRLLLRNPVLLRSATLKNRHALNALRTSSRAASSSSSPSPSPSQHMNLRKRALFVLSGLVLTGAWYYRDSLSALGSASTTSAPSPSPTSAEEEGKRIVAVDNESIYTGTVPPKTPISKDVGDDGRKVVEMLNPEEATKKLRRNEESWFVNRGRGVWRYDVVQIPSNDPIEDDHAEKILEVPGTAAVSDGEGDSDWMFWGVFDGHSGWTTSAKLRQVLIGFVARELNATFKAAVADPSLKTPEPKMIDEAIKRGFLNLDHEITHDSVEKVFKNPSKLFAAEVLAPALSGSCALLAFYESRSQLLRVAVTGDSRAVLGRLGKNGKWTATALSEDQTGSNAAEEKRMRAEHPGEDHVIRNGRVLGGLEPTRAFGDAFYKWSQETQMKIKNQFFGRTPSPLLKTPPYVTAEPVVTTTKIEPENGDFVVLATDGLWEMLTNEEVVGLVGKWIEEQKKDPKSASKGWFGGWMGGKKTGGMLPVEADSAEEASGQKTPIRVRQWGVNKEDERFVCEDRNAATHLVRNALGGKNTDMLCALLTLPSPYSRRYRDDLTVEVIFFGNSEKTGNVVPNDDASAKRNATSPQDSEPKAKL